MQQTGESPARPSAMHPPRSGDVCCRMTPSLAPAPGARRPWACMQLAGLVAEGVHQTHKTLWVASAWPAHGWPAPARVRAGGGRVSACVRVCIRA
eukprot:6180637-Pleurochrysis_carterae.AAC.1